jgi:superfamily II DNA/RNA helicase
MGCNNTYMTQNTAINHFNAKCKKDHRTHLLRIKNEQKRREKSEIKEQKERENSEIKEQKERENSEIKERKKKEKREKKEKKQKEKPEKKEKKQKEKPEMKEKSEKKEQKEKDKSEMNIPDENVPLKKRRPIPKKIRGLVWKEHFGESMMGACFCCKQKLEALDDWHAGHIVSHANGGKDGVANLRPVCISCNLSMGTENMDEFKERCYSA